MGLKPTLKQAKRRPLSGIALVSTAILAIGFLSGIGKADRTTDTTPAPPASETVPPDVVAATTDTTSYTGAIVPIRGPITDITFESIERRVEHAIDAGATMIVFEMDTPGGQVGSALDICNYIKNLDQVKTVAWINTDAYSAGSMISVACDEIVMTTAANLGDCGVILGGPTGPQEVPEGLRAKAESPVLEQFRDSAALNGYNLLLCESMVVKERVVYWIENVETGERRFVNEDEKKQLVDGQSSQSPFAAPDKDQEPTEWKVVESYYDPIRESDVPVTQPVVKATELLTMSRSKAMAFGFCKGVVRDVAELQARYNITNDPLRLESNWSEQLTGWMTSMPVRIFLLVIILLGAYVEFNTPGVGVPGLVALIGLVIFVGAPYLTGLANVWEIVLVFIGFGLIAAELFLIPGFGIAGISGVACVIIGLLATFIPEEPGRDFPIYWPTMKPGMDGLKTGVKVLAAGSAASIAGMVLFSRMLPRIRWLQGAVPLNPSADQVTVDDPYAGYARVGDRGLVETTLRPAGKARFGDVLVDVVSEGAYLDPGTEVEVIERQGNRVVVRRPRAEGESA